MAGLAVVLILGGDCVEGTVPALATLGPRVPMLRPEQVLCFAHDNVTPFER
jgi:hypothetical protein